METERKPLLDTFDWLIGIGAVPFQDPLIFVVAGFIVLIRHWPRMAWGFLQIAGVRAVKSWHCKIFPGAAVYLGNSAAPGITSSEAEKEPRTSTEPSEPGVVRPDTDAERTSRTSENVPAIEPAQHNYSRVELLTILAVQKDGEGKYLYSANKIADFVGGTRAEALNLIGQVRGTKMQPQPRTTGTTYRPKEGW